MEQSDTHSLSMTDTNEDTATPDQATVADRPSLIARTVDIAGEGNFPQGCAFSPDGLCILTSTAGDNRLRLYNTPPGSDSSESPSSLQTCLSAEGGDSVRSYEWYPHMNSSDAGTCCFLAASRDQPVHLYDAYNGRIRATYRPFNALDEMESPNVVSFSPDGQRVYAAGFRSDRMIHVFDTAIPGRDSTVLRLGKTRRSTDGQKGMVSAIAFSPQTFNHVFCVGTYSPGSIYVYDDRLPNAVGTVLHGGVCVVGHGKGHSRKKRRFVEMDEGETSEGAVGNIFSAAKVRWFQTRAQGGVTQLSFPPSNEYMLYSASRRSNAVLCWDLRMVSGNEDYASCPIRGVSSFATNSNTNQRLEFDFDEDGRRIFVGGVDNCVRIYNVQSGKQLGLVDGLDDAANGVSYTYNAASKSGLLAVAVGARRFQDDTDDEEEGGVRSTSLEMNAPGAVEIYRIPP